MNDEAPKLVWLPREDKDRRSKNVVAYSNGDTYVGELVGGRLRDGKGIYDYKEGGRRYDGEWKGGVKHGHATYINSTHEKFEGEFRGGHRTKGSKTYSNGIKVDGVWADNMLNVRGAHLPAIPPLLISLTPDYFLRLGVA